VVPPWLCLVTEVSSHITTWHLGHSRKTNTKNI
jgi:hypothetical protein